MKTLDFKTIRENNIKEINKKVEIYKLETGKIPKLVIIRANEDGSSAQYTQSIVKFGENVNVEVEVIKYSDTASELELANKIKELNQSIYVQGIMIQKPLPQNVSDNKLIELIDSNKDVEGLTSKNLGKLMLGIATIIPCTPKAVMEFIESNEIDIQGKNVVVIGRSDIVGKPIALLCLSKHATVTICHSRTKNIEAYTKKADIIISAVGKYNMLKLDMINDGVKIIDVGVNFENGEMVGDINRELLGEKADWITPVRGGIGSITTSILFKNLLESCDIHD